MGVGTSRNRANRARARNFEQPPSPRWIYNAHHALFEPASLRCLLAGRGVTAILITAEVTETWAPTAASPAATPAVRRARRRQEPRSCPAPQPRRRQGGGGEPSLDSRDTGPLQCRRGGHLPAGQRRRTVGASNSKPSSKVTLTPTGSFALAAVLAAHPMGRARKAPARPHQRRLRCDINASADLDAVSVVDCDDAGRRPG